METKQIKLDAIEITKKSMFEYDVRNEGVTRVEGIDDPSVESLVESIKAGREVPPVLLVPMGKGKYQIINGRRRILAFRHCGIKTIHSKIVKEESPSKLLQLSFLDDVNNGNSLEVTEKRDAFSRFIEMVTGEKGKLGSQTELSKAWGISQPTVSRAIEALKKDGKVDKDFAVSDSKAGRKKGDGKRVARTAVPAYKKEAMKILSMFNSIREKHNDKVENHLVDILLEDGAKGKKHRNNVTDMLTFLENLDGKIQNDGMTEETEG